MKSLIRWTATIGIVGATFLSSLLGTYSKALALPEDQIVKTLQPVPVFTIADEQGGPIFAAGEKDQKIIGVFISRQDAQQFYDQLKQKQPELASKVQVRLISLAQVYKLQASQANQNQVVINFVPKVSEVESAKKLLTERGEQYQGGVPLFVPRAGKESGLLVIKRENQDLIPFFFEKAAAVQMLEQYKKAKPDEAATAKIDVIPLESVISTLQQSNDQMLTKIWLEPTQETINFLRANNPNPSQPQNRPAQPPAATQSRPNPQPNNRPATPAAPNR
jgi:Tic22-like family